MSNTGICVIIPTFERPDYLEETLESVLHQTHQNWECLIVSDGDPAARMTVAPFLYRDTRFRFACLPYHTGSPAKVRAHGASILRHRYPAMPYVLFLDDDDPPYSVCFERLAETLDQSDAGGVYCQPMRINIGNQQVGAPGWLPPDNRLVLAHMVGPYRPISTISSLLLRWSIYEDCGGWEEVFTLVDDMDFVGAILCCAPLQAIPETYLHQRIHDNNHAQMHTPAMIDLTLARIYSYLGHANVTSTQSTI